MAKIEGRQGVAAAWTKAETAFLVMPVESGEPMASGSRATGLIYRLIGGFAVPRGRPMHGMSAPGPTISPPR